MIDRIIKDAAYRIKLDIEREIVENGKEFEDARRTAIKQYQFAGLESKHKRHITDAIYSMPMSDLQPAARTVIDARIYAHALHVNGLSDNWIRRLVFRLFRRVVRIR